MKFDNLIAVVMNYKTYEMLMEPVPIRYRGTDGRDSTDRINFPPESPFYKINHFSPGLINPNEDQNDNWFGIFTDVVSCNNWYRFQLEKLLKNSERGIASRKQDIEHHKSHATALIKLLTENRIEAEKFKSMISDLDKKTKERTNKMKFLLGDIDTETYKIEVVDIPTIEENGKVYPNFSEGHEHQWCNKVNLADPHNIDQVTAFKKTSIFTSTENIDLWARNYLVTSIQTAKNYCARETESIQYHRESLDMHTQRLDAYKKSLDKLTKIKGPIVYRNKKTKAKIVIDVEVDSQNPELKEVAKQAITKLQNSIEKNCTDINIVLN